MGNSKEHIKMVKAHLDKIGISEKCLRPKFAEGKDIGDIFEEMVEQGKLYRIEKPGDIRPSSDPFLDSIFDEWMNQAETIEQLKQEVLSLKKENERLKKQLAKAKKPASQKVVAEEIATA